MALITLDVPTESHMKIKQIQLAKEMAGEKVNLKEIYYEVIKIGLENYEKEKPSE